MTDSEVLTILFFILYSCIRIRTVYDFVSAELQIIWFINYYMIELDMFIIILLRMGKISGGLFIVHSYRNEIFNNNISMNNELLI